jgi:hypothetical protein
MIHTATYSGFVSHRRTRALFGNYAFDKPKQGAKNGANWQTHERR